MKKIRPVLLISTFIFVLFLLSACAGGDPTALNTWPGVTIDAEKQIAYLAFGNFVQGIDLQSGESLWRFPAKQERNLSFAAPPALTADGQLVVGALNKIVYSFDPNQLETVADGDNQVKTPAQKWMFEGADNNYYGGALVLGEKVFIPNINFILYALNQTGQEQWKFTAENALWSTPATDGETIYLGAMDHKIYALDPESGRTIWISEELGGAIVGTPTLGPDGQLFIGAIGSSFENLGGDVHALDAQTGRMLWDQPLTVSAWVWSGPALQDGILYFGDLNGSFYAAQAADGKIIWKNELPAPALFSSNPKILGTPLILDDRIYYGDDRGVLRILDKQSGEELTCRKVQNSKIYGPIQNFVAPDGSNTILVPLNGRAETLIALDEELGLRWFFPFNEKVEKDKILGSCQ